MGKIISGLCCVVVGLEVLIGVPLAVCLSFYAVTQCDGPATIAAPSFSLPPPILPPVAVAPRFEAPDSAPAGSAAPESPAEVAIQEAAQRVGSPLTGTMLAGDSTPAEFAKALHQIAAEDAASPSPPALDSELPVVPAIPEVPADSLAAALTQAAERLYQLADRCENQGQFGRADRVRALAREIREELSERSAETAEAPAATSTN